MLNENKSCIHCKGFGYTVNNECCANCHNINGTTCYMCENSKFYEECRHCYGSGMCNLRKQDIQLNA